MVNYIMNKDNEKHIKTQPKEVKMNTDVVKTTNFKRYREFSGLKQSQLAKLVGVSPVSVFQLEKRGCFDTRTAVKYARVLGCNPLFLLDGLSND
jgi:DNA-binding XRE family transcriptional regulator